MEKAFEKADMFSVGKLMFELLLASDDGSAPSLPHLDRGRKHYSNDEVRCPPVARVFDTVLAPVLAGALRLVMGRWLV